MPLPSASITLLRARSLMDFFSSASPIHSAISRIDSGILAVRHFLRLECSITLLPSMSKMAAAITIEIYGHSYHENTVPIIPKRKPRSWISQYQAIFSIVMRNFRERNGSLSIFAVQVPLMKSMQQATIVSIKSPKHTIR